MSLLAIFSTMSVCAQSTARVVRMKDGDTYVLVDGSNAFTARLLKIDAPELKQKSGIEAYRFVNGTIAVKMVGYTGTSKDRYGRSLVSITINGLRLESLIIRTAGLGII